MQSNIILAVCDFFSIFSENFYIIVWDIKIEKHTRKRQKNMNIVYICDMLISYLIKDEVEFFLATFWFSVNFYKKKVSTNHILSLLQDDKLEN